MTDSLFSSFAKSTNYIADSYSQYAAPINFLTVPGIFLGTTASHLYQMTQTGVSLGSMAVALVDTTIQGYALPMMARTGAEMISNTTGLNANMLNIPAQIGAQALYTKVKNTYNAFNNYHLMLDSQDENGHTKLISAAKMGHDNTVNVLGWG